MEKMIGQRISSILLKSHISGRPYCFLVATLCGNYYRIRSHAVETSLSSDPKESFEVNELRVDMESSLAGYTIFQDFEGAMVSRITKYIIEEEGKSYLASCAFFIDHKEAFSVSGGDMPFTICVENVADGSVIGAREFPKNRYVPKA